MRAGAPHADALGVAAHQIEDLAADQMVIQHHVRLLHHLQPAQGQQPHVARPGAHQAISPCAPSSPAAKLCKSCSSCRSACAVWPLATSVAKRPPKVFSQKRRRSPIEASRCLTRRASGPPPAPSAPNWRAAAPPAFAQQPRQHRRPAAGRYGHHQRRAIDDRWEDKRAARLVVHHVGQHPAFIRFGEHRGVQRVVVRGGDRQNTSSSCGGSKVFPARAVALADVVVPVPVRATAQLSVFQPRRAEADRLCAQPRHRRQRPAPDVVSDRRILVDSPQQPFHITER